MVCKGEVYKWFKELDPSNRIDVVCGLINMCTPLEVRYFGSCVESLGKKDFISLREAELQANNAEIIAKLANLHDDAIRCKLITTLALLHSCEIACSDVIFKILCNFDSIKKIEGDPQDLKLLRDIILIYTMASYHPVFPFGQKSVIHSHLSYLQQISKEAISCYEEDVEEELVYGCANAPSKFYYSQNQILFRNLELEGMFWKKAYRISVIWNSGDVTHVLKSHQEMNEFHQQLYQLTSEDFRQNDIPWTSTIPCFPAAINCESKENMEITEDMIPKMAEYLSQLILFLRSNPICCDISMKFLSGNSSEITSNQTMSPKSSQLPKSNLKGVSVLLNTSSTPPLLDTSIPSSSSKNFSCVTTPVHGSASCSVMTSSLSPISVTSIYTSSSPTSHINSSPVSTPIVGSEKTKSTSQSSKPPASPNSISSIVCSSSSINFASTQSSSSMSSPYSSPSASVTNSRSTSPKNKLFSSNGSYLQNDGQKIHEQNSLLLELKKESYLKKHLDVLNSFTVDQLKNMSDDQLKNLGLRHGAMNRLRKIVEKLQTVPNGLYLLPKSVSNCESKPCSGSHPSSQPSSGLQQVNSKSYTSEQNTHVTRPTSLMQISHLKQSNSASTQKAGCVLSPSNVSQSSHSVSTFQPLNSLVPKSVSNNVIKTQSQLDASVKRPSGSRSVGNESSSSEYSSSPPSPESDNVFVTSTVESKTSSELQDGNNVLHRQSQYPVQIPNISRRPKMNYICNQTTNSNHSIPTSSCPPVISMHHHGIPVDIAHIPPPCRANLRPSISVPNIIYKTLNQTICMPPSVGTTRTQNPGTVIYENSNSSCQNLPSALPIHPTSDSSQVNSNSQYPIRVQAPFSPDNIVVKSCEVDSKGICLPSTSFVNTNPSMCGSSHVSSSHRAGKTNKYSGCGQPNKFTKASLVSREKEEDKFSLPGISLNSKCQTTLVAPTSVSNVSSHHACNCNNTSPPPQQSNPTTPITFMPGFMSPLFYPYTPPRGFIPPNSAGNNSISPNIQTGFGFLGNPNQLPNGITMSEQMRFQTQGSYPAIHQHMQPQSNQPSNTQLVGQPPQFVNYHGNFVLPMSSGPSNKPPSCYNCGNIGHQGFACKEATMEEMSNNGHFRLNYTQNQKNLDASNDVKS